MSLSIRIDAFEGPLDLLLHLIDEAEVDIYDVSISDGQNKTSNNDRYLRLFWEVKAKKVGKDKHYKFYAKGGDFRKWYGNLEYIIDWSETARAFYSASNSARIIPEYLWDREGITWTLLSSSRTGFRYLPKGATFDMTGSSIFIKDEADLALVLGILNSNSAEYFLDILSSTIAYQIHEIRKVPIKYNTHRVHLRISEMTLQNIEISRHDWDSFETSWDFQRHPML